MRTAFLVFSAVIFTADVLYIFGAVYVWIMYGRMWRSLKRGIVEQRLTDEQMQFLDIIAEDRKPVLLGLVTVVLWPVTLWRLWRHQRRQRT